MNRDNYAYIHLHKLNRTEKYTTDYVTKKIRENNSIVFTKFGDGEYQCMAGFDGENCDGDRYTIQLRNELRAAFAKLCDMSYDTDDDRILIGRWHYPNEIAYYCDLYLNHQANLNITGKEIPFVNYHLIYNDDNFALSRSMYDLVYAIQEYSNHKVLITNTNNRRLKTFFKMNDYIPIRSNTWFSYEYDDIINAAESILDNHPRSLILIAGGLASKVLIARLCEKYREASFLDIGSGFDIIATRRHTRCHKHCYAAEVDYYRDLLPYNWENLL